MTSAEAEWAHKVAAAAINRQNSFRAVIVLLWSGSRAACWRVFVLLRRVLVDFARRRGHFLPERLHIRRQLVAVLDERDDLPYLIVRQDTVPGRHAGHPD